MIRVRRRGTTRSTPLLVISVLVLCGLLVPSVAAGGSIATTKAQIARLSTTLSQEEQTSETTANEYDAAKVNLANINADIVNLNTKEVRKRAAIVVTSQALVKALVNAYVFGAAESQIMALFNQDVTSSDATKVYEDQVVGNLNKIKNAYEAAKHSLDTTLKQVTIQRSQSRTQTQHVAALLNENIQNEDATQATLTKVTRELKAQIIAYEINAGAQAARARNIAGEEEAVAAASAVGGTPAANDVLAAIAAAAPPIITEIAGTAQGDLSLHWAESQLGVPYVWGGETPGVGFDCSGLVQWSWGKAGIAIPRTTESEWPAMVHVSLSQLQPGDLLFYFNLDNDHEVDHVVMYAGSGPFGTSTVIAAAHSGTNVSYEPLFTFGLVGAARP
jgi:cell wall-associated NlpC family hydrolase